MNLSMMNRAMKLVAQNEGQERNFVVTETNDRTIIDQFIDYETGYLIVRETSKDESDTLIYPTVIEPESGEIIKPQERMKQIPTEEKVTIDEENGLKITTLVTLGTAGLGAAANAGKLGSLGTDAIAQLGKVATALEPVGKGITLGGAFSGGVGMGEGIGGQDIWGNALSPEERQQRFQGGALNAALSTVGGAASLGK